MSKYYCQNPEKSNIEGFRKFARKQALSDSLAAILSFIVGGVISGVAIYSISLSNYEISIQPFDCLKIFLLFILLLTFYYSVKIIWNKWNCGNAKLILFPLISAALYFSLIMSFNEMISSNHLISTIVLYVELAFGLYILIAIGGTGIHRIVFFLIDSYLTLPKNYEYNSSGKHTGIIFAYNHTRIGIANPSGEGYQYLVKTLFKRKVEAYRVYVCLTQNEIKEAISNPDVQNLWIFGHGSYGSVEVTDGCFVYSTLKESNIPLKGYIHQCHCNCKTDDDDKYSLVDLFVDEKLREHSTDSGMKHSNARKRSMNVKLIKKYLSENNELNN